MYSLNEVNLIGNLTSTPELKQTQKGTAMVNFGIATNESRKLENGEYENIAEFHNCVAFGKTAELISQKIQKGQKIYIKGKLKSSPYEDKEGKTKKTVSIFVEDMIFLTPTPKKDLFEVATELFNS